jgi:hypothetical protein
MCVGFGPRPGDVVREAAQLHGRGAEALVPPGRTEVPGEGSGVPVDHEVELVGPAAQQDVPYRPPDQVDLVGRTQRLQQRRGRRQSPNALDQARWRRNVHSWIFARGPDGAVTGSVRMARG